MKSRFCSLSKGKQISLAVLSLHAALLLFLAIDHWISTPLTKSRKVVVHTIVIDPPQKITPAQITAKTNPALGLPNTSQRTAAPPLKKQPTKQASAKPALKQPPPVQQEPILQEIESSLEAISSLSVSPSNKPEITIPVFYGSMPVENALATEIERRSIQEQIASFLQETLQLPEFGEVKMALSIDRFGRLVSLEVLEAKSVKNAEFLKNRLPNLQFPCLNESTSLTIVFSNAL